MKQQMVDRLFLLVTGGATVRVVHAAPGQPITSPAPVVLNQPHEKFTFFRSPRFSNYLCRLKANSPLEEGCIHRSGWVLSRGREPPNVCVSNTRLKGNLFNLNLADDQQTVTKLKLMISNLRVSWNEFANHEKHHKEWVSISTYWQHTRFMNFCFVYSRSQNIFYALH
jgi:hypothetical protein